MEREWRRFLSHFVMFPVQGERRSGPVGMVLDWRGIPLADPFQFDAIGPNQSVRIVKRWQEGHHVFLKLVHPTKGTTVDYAVRWLFHPRLQAAAPPTERVFTFLEIAPGCPGAGESVPVWTVVERLSLTELRTLSPEEIQAEQDMIDTIVNEKPGVSLEALDGAFGPLESWQNPDWGDPGNIHLVCPLCLGPLADGVVSCPDCAPPRSPEQPRRSRWKFWQ
jgi:hypothetical protein